MLFSKTSDCFENSSMGEEDYVEDAINWFADNMEPFYNSISPIWSKVQSKLK